MAAIVIIGAGPGISAATAQLFASNGFDVGLVSRDARHLGGLLADLRGAGAAAAAQSADAGDDAALSAAIARLTAGISPPSVLLFNAANMRVRNVLDLRPEDLVADFRVGVAGALAAVQALLPALRSSAGTVLLTGGGYAFEPDPEMMTLGIQKAALRNLAFGLHLALKPHGVHVATATVKGAVGSTAALMPDVIAQAYWAAHVERQERELQIG